MWIVNSKKLRALRVGKTWTVEHLAERAGVSDRTLRELEARDRSARFLTMELLAKALGEPMDSFVRAGEKRERAAKEDPEARRPDLAAASAPPKKRVVARTELDHLVFLEAERPTPTPIGTKDGPVDMLTAKRFQDVFTAFAAHSGARFGIRATVDAQRGASAIEAELLASRIGIAARFLLVCEIAPGERLSVTVHSARAEHTLWMQERLGRDVAVCVRLVVVPEESFAAGKGFAFFLSERPRPWGLVVESVEEEPVTAGKKKKAR